MEGTVKYYDPIKCFGFIKDDDSDAEYFFHIKDCIDPDINRGNKVTFDIAESKYKKGGVQAINVTLF
jgi:CspA family cold shock protein